VALGDTEWLGGTGLKYLPNDKSGTPGISQAFGGEVIIAMLTLLKCPRFPAYCFGGIILNRFKGECGLAKGFPVGFVFGNEKSTYTAPLSLVAFL